MESLEFICELFVESRDIEKLLGDWEKYRN